LANRTAAAAISVCSGTAAGYAERSRCSISQTDRSSAITDAWSRARPGRRLVSCGRSSKCRPTLEAGPFLGAVVDGVASKTAGVGQPTALAAYSAVRSGDRPTAMSSTGHVVSSAKAAGEANSVLCKGSYSGVRHQHAHATRSATGDEAVQRDGSTLRHLNPVG
jgi:hypothetical protein